MTVADNEPVRGLISQLTGKPFSAGDMQNRFEFVAGSPIDWFYVAELDGQVVGFLCLRLRERIVHASRYMEVSVLVTDASVRRNGVGRALMDFAEQAARDAGCVGVFLVSGFGRKDEAHLFYERLGYDKTGYRFVKLF
ncbi:MAG: GNAT family N-acetyltransferase [Anaerolineae bacterium]|nr:GNAT family N-acetyltransferase [Anaerolineae bacterium]